MEYKISITYAKLNVENPRRITATKLRGYLGNVFADDSGFHHHDDSPYRYPLVQYKRIRDGLMVLGINDYAKTVFDRLPKIKEIVLPSHTVPVASIELSSVTHHVTDETTRYEFQTPWIALNSKNYEIFKGIDRDLRHRFLENILIGNLLSSLKGMNITINHRLYVTIRRLRPMYVMAHQNPFHAFYAQFVTNLDMPDLVGIGNSTSKGFGAIKRA